MIYCMVLKDKYEFEIINISDIRELYMVYSNVYNNCNRVM